MAVNSESVALTDPVSAQPGHRPCLPGRSVMRKGQAVACANCETCGADYGQPCRTRDGKATRPHKARFAKAGLFVAQAYCENESQYGFGCGTEGCPHCG